MLDKGKHFLLLTVSTLIMAIGTYFFKFTNNFCYRYFHNNILFKLHATSYNKCLAKKRVWLLI